MTEDRSPTRASWRHTLILGLSAAALSVAAAFVMLSAFMYYDDEGYVLMSLRNFAEHGGLYREVYSQYGPFPYAFYAALHMLGMPFTHAAGRFVTLIAWAGAAVLAAMLVRQVSRSMPAALAVLAATFAYLWVMASEPSHPGGLITIITALMAAYGYRLISGGRTTGWAILAGGTVAALALTKINVGGFAGFAALAWMVLHARSDGIRRWAPVWLIPIAVLLPLALMRSLLGTEWVQIYAVLFAGSAISVFAAVLPASRPLVSRGVLAWSVAAGATVAVIVIGFVLARGSAAVDLLDGILIRPMKQAASFSLPYRWPVGTLAGAIGSFALCGACVILRRRGVAHVDRLVASLRLVAAVGVAIAVIQFPAQSPDRLTFAFAAPSLWVFVWPLAGEKDSAVSGRLWVGLLMLGQFLHAFPVAGSQMAWGTFLFLPIAGAGAWEAVYWLRQRGVFSGSAVRAPAAVLKIAVVVIALWLGHGLGQTATRYRDGSDLGLPGAELLRLPSESAALFQILTLNAAAHASVLFSEPGMLSLNLWSGVKTPTRANTTLWFSLLDGGTQRGIMAALEDESKACVIVQRTNLEFLRQRGFGPAGELHDYIAGNFSPAFTLDGFEFRVRNGRIVQPLMIGEIQLQQENEARAGRENTVLEIAALLPSGRAVEQIEVLSAGGASMPALVLSAANARVEAAPLDLTGPPAAWAPMRWPLQLEAPAMLRVHFDRHAEVRPMAGALITFRGVDGEEIALARLKQ